MTIFESLTNRQVGHTGYTQLVLCLIVAVFPALFHGEAQASQKGSASGSLTLSLTINSNPGGCGIGTVDSAVSTPKVINLSATQGSTTALSHVYSGSAGLPVYCSEDFYVSADGWAANRSYSNAGSTRYLYNKETGAASYKYNLTLGPTAPTSLSGTVTSPTWAGLDSIGCQVAFTGDAGTRITTGKGPGAKVTSITVTPGAGSVNGTKTSGCYRSGLDESYDGDNDSVMTTLYIPWGYYIDTKDQVTNINGFNTGEYTDTVYLALTY